MRTVVLLVFAAVMVGIHRAAVWGVAEYGLAFFLPAMGGIFAAAWSPDD